jgi:hypothetical protein
MEKIHWYEPRDNLFTKVEIYMVHSGHTERRGNLFPWSIFIMDLHNWMYLFSVFEEVDKRS